jgi:hypothetical protein
MEVIFSFLFWVATFSHVDEDTGSKMDLHNIATVITPNVLYAKGKDGAPVMDDSFSAIEVIKTLIDNTQEFSQVNGLSTILIQGSIGFSSDRLGSYFIRFFSRINYQRYHSAMWWLIQERSRTISTQRSQRYRSKSKWSTRTTNSNSSRYRSRSERSRSTRISSKTRK